jgi:hypothetical protein
VTALLSCRSTERASCESRGPIVSKRIVSGVTIPHRRFRRVVSRDLPSRADRHAITVWQCVMIASPIALAHLRSEVTP